MKYIKKCICIVIVVALLINITSVYGSFMDDVLGQGNTFFSSSGNSDKLATDITSFFKKSFVPVIESIGQLIFFTVAAVLGVKYIWSGVEGKSSVKETLPTFVVGACFFYLADSIYNISTTTITSFTGGTSLNTMEGNIWSTVSYIVNIFAIAGIVALGLKYMFSSAETKADIKRDLIPVFIGLVFVYATSGILNLIVGFGTDVTL